MKEQLLGAGQRVWENFRAFSPGQKAVTILATVALLLGGFLFMSWKNKPDYAPLYSNLAATDASAIVDKLNGEKIPYELAAGGTEIRVPKDKVYATRLTMSSAGLPGSGQSGYSLLDKEGVTTSEFKQQVDYQRAIEGELAKTIQSINGVSAASVHLAIPKQDVFNDGTQKTTAAVMLTTAGGTQLTPAQVQSVVYLVSSSVPNMTTGDVTVTDSTGRVLAAPGDDLGGLAGADNQTKMTNDYNKRLADSLQNMINAAIGSGRSVVTVNADLDFDNTSTTTNRYTFDENAPPLSEQESSETYTGNGTGAGGTLGAGQPAVDTAGQNGDGAGNYSKTNRTVNNALGTVTETTHNAPGAVKKLNVAVLLDESAKNLNVGAIEELVRSAVGLDAARGDSIAIKAMPFDETGKQAADAAAAAASTAAADKAAHDRLMSLIKQGILAGLLLVILLGTWLASRRRKKHEELPPPTLDDSFFDEQIDEYVPENPPQPLAVVNDIEEARERRRALVALADEQPDDVARVLSGWLNSREG